MPNRWPTNEELAEWRNQKARLYVNMPIYRKRELLLIREIEYLRALCATAAKHAIGSALRQELKDAAEGK